MKDNIILIGFMGCGKTSVGRALSRKLSRKMIDTDSWIEQKQGKSITQIFEANGEKIFREMETQCILELIKTIKHHIISVGGGLPITNGNDKLLKQLGTVIYLKTTPKVVYNRLKSDTTRPLLQVAEPMKRIEELLEAREPKYLSSADRIIDVSEMTVSEIVNKIVNEYAKE